MRLTYSSQCGARVIIITALRMAAIVNKMIAQVGGGMRNDLVSVPQNERLSAPSSRLIVK